MRVIKVVGRGWLRSPRRLLYRMTGSRSRGLLIVNADDFGISPGVNRGIIQAHTEGILTSTTLMANMPSAEDAVRLAKLHPALGVGVHLNLTAGIPLLPADKVSSLVGSNGRFLPMGAVLRRLTMGWADTAQIEAELAAQIERAIGSGLVPTHLDSHHHVHVHPVMQPIVVRLALRYGIPALRSTEEAGVFELLDRAGALTQRKGEFDIESPRGKYLKCVVLSLLGRMLKGRVRRAGLATPDHFRGIEAGLAFSADGLFRVLEQLPKGVTELMCHPGFVDDELRAQTSYSAGRDTEREALLEPAGKAILSRVQVRLGGYRDLRAFQG